MNKRVILEMDAKEVLAVLSAMECCDPLNDLEPEDVPRYESAFAQMVQKTKKFFPRSVTSLLKVVPGSKS